MKFIFLILVSFGLSTASPERDLEIERVLKILDHKMTEQELFDSLGMEIPTKERTFPDQEKLSNAIKKDPIAGIILFTLIGTIFISIVQQAK